MRAVPSTIFLILLCNFLEPKYVIFTLQLTDYQKKTRVFQQLRKLLNQTILSSLERHSSTY